MRGASDSGGRSEVAIAGTFFLGGHPLDRSAASFEDSQIEDRLAAAPGCVAAVFEAVGVALLPMTQIADQPAPAP
jgi:hypothetical protein